MTAGAPKIRTWQTVARGWEQHAACRNTTDPDLFFPISYDSSEARDQVAQARAVCASCPVWRLCLTDAMSRERWLGKDRRAGIWGGTTPSQRYAFAKAHPQHIQAVA